MLFNVEKISYQVLQHTTLIPPSPPKHIMTHLCLSLKSGLVNLLLYCFSMLKLYIRSCRSITHFVYPPHPHLHITSQGCLSSKYWISGLVCKFFPLLPSPKKTFDVFQNIYWILYWNQISGLVTHQAHHRPPSNPLRIIIIWCLSKYILKSDIMSCRSITHRSCKPFTVLLFNVEIIY